MKECGRCLEFLELREFGKSKAQKDGYLKNCKRCVRSQNSHRKMKKRGLFTGMYQNDLSMKEIRNIRIKEIKELKKQTKSEIKYLEEYIGFLKKEIENMNRDSTALYNKTYYEDNIAYFREKSYKRSLKEKRAVPKWLKKEQKMEIDAIYKKCWSMTHKKDDGVVYNVDHIIPINGKNVCGLHVPWNLQILPRTENIKKRNKLIDF